MIDAHNYSVDHKLKDGTAVTIRAIRPDDKKRMVEAFKNLEPESIYTRFFGFKSELSDEELKTATEVDFEKTVALVVTIPAGGAEETIIGAGRYIMYDPAKRFAQRGNCLHCGGRLPGAGDRKQHTETPYSYRSEKRVCPGSRRMCLPENIAMLAVFARSGLPMKKSLEEGAVHVTLSLTAHAP